MTKSFSENAMDSALDYVAGRADRLVLCSGAPGTASEATATVSGGGAMLASLTLNAASGAVFAVAPGVASGRRLIAAAQNEIAVLEAGTADHLALVDTVAGELLVVTELTEPQTLAAGTVISTRSFSTGISAPA